MNSHEHPQRYVVDADLGTFHVSNQESWWEQECLPFDELELCNKSALTNLSVEDRHFEKYLR